MRLCPRNREAGSPGAARLADLRALRAACEDYAPQHSKAWSPFRQTHQNRLGLADLVLAWLAERDPSLDLAAGTWSAGWTSRAAPMPNEPSITT